MIKHRSLIPIIGFMAVITAFSFILPNFDFVFSSDLNFVNSTLALIIILFPCVEGLVRYLIISKSYDPGKYFFDIPISEKPYRQGLYFLILIAVILVVPFFKGRVTFSMVEVVSSAVIWSLISVLLLYITDKKTRIHFMRDSIIVKGIDLRLEFPLNDPIRSNTGIYSYRDFSGFYVEGQNLKLFLRDKQGHIHGTLPKDKIQHVSAFLISKEIHRVQVHELSQY